MESRGSRWLFRPADLWKPIATTGGYYRFQSAANPAVYLTGASAGAPLTPQTIRTDGSQERKLG
jgi:hypothetical protein